MLTPEREVSRRHTTLVVAPYLGQLSLGTPVGTRPWVRHGLRLRVAESRADRALYATIVRERHYLGRWPVPPKTLVLAYLADLAGVERGPAGCAAMVMVASLAGQYHPAIALGVAPVEVLQLVRSWRADDLEPTIAPDLMPAVLRRVVRGDRGRGALAPLAEEWARRKLREGGMRARPRLLLTYADPSVGHDGALYLGAGATYCGTAGSGRLAFAWALDPSLKESLAALGRAVQERAA